MKNGGTEDEVVATLLHNAPENQDGEERLKDFQARFDTTVPSSKSTPQPT